MSSHSIEAILLVEALEVALLGGQGFVLALASIDHCAYYSLMFFGEWIVQEVMVRLLHIVFFDDDCKVCVREDLDGEHFVGCA